MSDKKRRGNGEGTILEREDGTWFAQVSLGYAGSGKRIRRTLSGATKKEVQDKVTKLKSSKLDGTACELTKLTVSQFLTRWLEDAARPRIRPTSYVSYEGVIRLHIGPRIGGIRLEKLTPLHVQNLYG